MGHANLSNLSDLFLRHLYAKGKITIKDAVRFAQKKGEEVRASEGGYDDPGMLSYAFEEIVSFLLMKHDGETSVIVPHNMSDEQQKVYNKWRKNEELAGEFYEEDKEFCGELGILDSIEWKFGPGWRKEYPELPRLGYFSN